MLSNREHLNLESPPGFQGLRDHLPLHVYEQALPHWRQDGATYFVTFRLNDSLPQAKLGELKAFKAEFDRNLAKQDSRQIQRSRRDEMAREMMSRVETWLDQGSGDCHLRSANAAAAVSESMRNTDGTRCELDCFVVMPNHVHAIVRPMQPTSDPLEKILRTWKGSSAKRINESLRRNGALWQRESFDRIIRDEMHLWQVVQYIGNNPRKAGLTSGQSLLWIRPEWVELGWTFEA